MTEKSSPWFVFFLSLALAISGVSVIGVTFARKKFFAWMEKTFPM